MLFDCRTRGVETGGFSNTLNEASRKPDLYSTYWSLMVLRELSPTSIKKFTIGNSIEEILNRILSERPREESISEIFYGLNILEMIDYDSNLKEEILSYLQELNSEDFLIKYFRILSLDKIGMLTQSEKENIINSIIEDLKKQDFSNLNYNQLGKIDKQLTIINKFGLNLDFVNNDSFKVEFSKLKKNVPNLLSYENIDNLNKLLNLPEVSYETLIILINNQNIDGGFSAVNSLSTDIQGTYIATKILKKIGFESKKRDQIINLVMKSYIENKGFHPLYKNYPSVVQTYYALNIKNFLNQPINTIHEKYLLELLGIWIKNKENPDIQSVYYTIESLKLLGYKLTDKEKDFLDNYVEDELNNSYELKNQKNLIKLNMLLDISSELDNNAQEINKEVIIKQIDSIPQLDIISTAHLIELAHKLNITLPQQDSLEDWLKKQQNIDGGFGEEGKSYIYTTYKATLALSLLNSEPVNKKNLKKWLDSSKESQRGGFKMGAESSGSDLISTYSGLQLQALLEE